MAQGLELRHERAPMKKTVFLHIGRPKTGTSLVQTTFLASPGILERFSIRYLQAGTRVFDDGGHHVLVMAGLGERGQRISPDKSPDLVRRSWDEAIAEIEGCAETRIFISSELLALDVTRTADIETFRDGLSQQGKHDMKVVVTLRDPADFVNSVYSQRVRDGFSGTVHKYMERIGRLLDWEALIKPWAEVFGMQNLILLRFEALDRSAMVDDFFHLVFGETLEAPLFPSRQVNPSLPHSAILFLRELNRSAMPDSEKAAIRNYLHTALGRHQTGMKKADFLRDDEKALVRRQCRWPATVN